jgi:dTMP kinase
VRRRGRFITFEGGEGAGKSTQAARLATWLGELGIAALLTREPGGSVRAEALRELLLSGRVAPFGVEAEAIVFAIARADHLAEKIRPALEAGTWVICDRFADSTWAYQGSAGASPQLLARLDEIAVGGDRPDLTIVLDVLPAIGLARLRARSSAHDRFEQDAADLQTARRQAFLEIARREPERCVVIDATLDPAVVGRLVRAAVVERLGPIDGAAA